MTFPPAEKYFNVPSEIIHGCYLFSRGRIGSGNPIYLVIDTVANYSQFLLCLVDSGGAKQYHGIVKTMLLGLTALDFMQVFFCIFSDTAYKGLPFCLPGSNLYDTGSNDPGLLSDQARVSG